MISDYVLDEEEYLDQLERENEVYLVALNRIANKMPKTGKGAGAMAKVARDALNEPPEGLRNRLLYELVRVKFLLEQAEYQRAIAIAKMVLEETFGTEKSETEDEKAG